MASWKGRALGCPAFAESSEAWVRAWCFFPQTDRGFPGGSAVENLPDNAGDPGSVPEWGRSPGGGRNPLQDSCLELIPDLLSAHS